jgi:hypothetical protein
LNKSLLGITEILALKHICQDWCPNTQHNVKTDVKTSSADRNTFTKIVIMQN